MTSEPTEAWHGTTSGYVHRKCRCAACKAANTEYHRNRRTLKVNQAKEAGTTLHKMRPATPTDGTETWHGTTNGYGYHKCRCKRCSAANTEYLGKLRRERLAMRREDDAGNGSVPNPMRGTGDESWHGTAYGYGHHACRCSPCKKAMSDYGKQYRDENPEKVAEWRARVDERNPGWKKKWAADYYQVNRGRITAYGREWARANPERKKAQGIRWRAANPQRVRELRRANYHANLEAKRASARRWRSANPERAAANLKLQRAFYKARKRNAPTVRFTQSQLADRMAYWGNRCYMCGGPFEHVDHVKPLARGGHHTLSNLRPACHRHNVEKNARWHGPRWIMGLTGALRPDEPIPMEQAAA